MSASGSATAVDFRIRGNPREILRVAKEAAAERRVKQGCLTDDSEKGPKDLLVFEMDGRVNNQVTITFDGKAFVYPLVRSDEASATRYAIVREMLIACGALTPS